MLRIVPLKYIICQIIKLNIFQLYDAYSEDADNDGKKVLKEVPFPIVSYLKHD